MYDKHNYALSKMKNDEKPCCDIFNQTALLNKTHSTECTIFSLQLKVPHHLQPLSSAQGLISLPLR